MKICVIFYHKNASVLFKPHWIQKCIQSLKQQTYKEFDVLELNYDQTSKQLYEGSIFENVMFPNHVDAMNYLINKARDLEYDYIFNSNIDDYYAPNRIEEQLKYLENYDMVSSDYNVIKESKNKDIIIGTYETSKLDIKQNLIENNNIIPHPCVAWKTSFFDNLKYENEIPAEDLRLWQRAIEIKTIFIVPKKLLFYRIHDNQITQLTKQTSADIYKQAIDDFTKCFEKSTRNFLGWRQMRDCFVSWWKKFHPEKQLPNDYELRTIIDQRLGEPIPRRGWFYKIRNNYIW